MANNFDSLDDVTGQTFCSRLLSNLCSSFLTCSCKSVTASQSMATSSAVSFIQALSPSEVPACLKLSEHFLVLVPSASWSIQSHDSTEVAIQKMIEASQRMLDIQSQVEGEAREEGWGINPVMKRHLELEIKSYAIMYKMYFASVRGESPNVFLRLITSERLKKRGEFGMDYDDVVTRVLDDLAECEREQKGGRK